MTILRPPYNVGLMLLNLQGKNQLCDLLLRAGGVSVAVHSMVLAAHCPQFIPQLLQLISADHKDSSLPIMQLGNDDYTCKEDVLRMFIAFLYGQAVNICKEDRQEMLLLIKILDLDHLERLFEKTFNSFDEIEEIYLPNNPEIFLENNEVLNDGRESNNSSCLNAEGGQGMNKSQNCHEEKNTSLLSGAPMVYCSDAETVSNKNCGNQLEVNEENVFEINNTSNINSVNKSTSNCFEFENKEFDYENECLIELTVKEEEDNCELTVEDNNRNSLSRVAIIQSPEEILVESNFARQQALSISVDCSKQYSSDSLEYLFTTSNLKKRKKQNDLHSGDSKSPKLFHNEALSVNDTDIAITRSGDNKSRSIGSLHCGVCKAPFRRCSDLVHHIVSLEHFSTTCPICDFQTPDTASQRSHFELHDSPLPFFCCGCDLRFRSRAQLAMHLPKHSNTKPFSCGECGRAFKWRHALQAHVLRHRSMGHLLCDICGFSTNYITSFKAHQQQHTGQAFTCPHAGCSFKAFRKDNLKAHLLTHSNLRPHQCDVCGNSFSLARNLSRHMKLHSGTRLLCDAVSNVNCSFSTTRPDKLSSHLNRKHNMNLDGSTRSGNANDSRPSQEVSKVKANIETNISKEDILADDHSNLLKYKTKRGGIKQRKSIKSQTSSNTDSTFAISEMLENKQDCNSNDEPCENKSKTNIMASERVEGDNKEKLLTVETLAPENTNRRRKRKVSLKPMKETMKIVCNVIDTENVTKVSGNRKGKKISKKTSNVSSIRTIEKPFPDFDPTPPLKVKISRKTCSFSKKVDKPQVSTTQAAQPLLVLPSGLSTVHPISLPAQPCVSYIIATDPSISLPASSPSLLKLFSASPSSTATMLNVLPVSTDIVPSSVLSDVPATIDDKPAITSNFLIETLPKMPSNNSRLLAPTLNGTPIVSIVQNATNSKSHVLSDTRMKQFCMQSSSNTVNYSEVADVLHHILNKSRSPQEIDKLSSLEYKAAVSCLIQPSISSIGSLASLVTDHVGSVANSANIGDSLEKSENDNDTSQLHTPPGLSPEPPAILNTSDSLQLFENISVFSEHHSSDDLQRERVNADESTEKLNLESHSGSSGVNTSLDISNVGALTLFGLGDVSSEKDLQFLELREEDLPSDSRNDMCVLESAESVTSSNIRYTATVSSSTICRERITLLKELEAEDNRLIMEVHDGDFNDMKEAEGEAEEVIGCNVTLHKFVDQSCRATQEAEEVIGCNATLHKFVDQSRRATQEEEDAIGCNVTLHTFIDQSCRATQEDRDGSGCVGSASHDTEEYHDSLSNVTASLLTDNRNTPSLLTDNRNTTSLLTDNRDTPSLLTDNQDTTSLLTDNRDTTSLLTDNRNTPSLLTDNQDTTSLLSDNRDTTSLLTNNRDTPSSLTDNRDTTSLLTDNQDTPLLTDNQDTPLLTDNQDTPSAQSSK